jgi:hypothetical protein
LKLQVLAVSGEKVIEPLQPVHDDFPAMLGGDRIDGLLNGRRASPPRSFMKARRTRIRGSSSPSSNASSGKRKRRDPIDRAA